MIYRDFAGIEVKDRIGVSPVGGDTLEIARQVARMEFSTALDMGTGSGFVPIYLGALGRRCDGCDIDKWAVASAQANARVNNLQVAFFCSDLFEVVAGVYDLVIFNPPYGTTGSGPWARLARLMKSMLPKESRLLGRLAYLLVRRTRRDVIRRFLAECPAHLASGGWVVVLLHRNELDLVAGTTLRVLADLDHQRLIALTPGSPETNA